MRPSVWYLAVGLTLSFAAACESGEEVGSAPPRSRPGASGAAGKNAGGAAGTAGRSGNGGATAGQTAGGSAGAVAAGTGGGSGAGVGGTGGVAGSAGGVAGSAGGGAGTTSGAGGTGGGASGTGGSNAGTGGSNAGTGGTGGTGGGDAGTGGSGGSEPEGPAVVGGQCVLAGMPNCSSSCCKAGGENPFESDIEGVHAKLKTEHPEWFDAEGHVTITEVAYTAAVAEKLQPLIEACVVGGEIGGVSRDEIGIKLSNGKSIHVDVIISDLSTWSGVVYTCEPADF